MNGDTVQGFTPKLVTEIINGRQQQTHNSASNTKPFQPTLISTRRAFVCSSSALLLAMSGSSLNNSILYYARRNVQSAQQCGMEIVGKGLVHGVLNRHGDVVDYPL